MAFMVRLLYAVNIMTADGLASKRSQDNTSFVGEPVTPENENAWAALNIFPVK